MFRWVTVYDLIIENYKRFIQIFKNDNKLKNNQNTGKLLSS